MQPERLKGDNVKYLVKYTYTCDGPFGEEPRGSAEAPFEAEGDEKAKEIVRRRFGKGAVLYREVPLD